MDRQGWDQEPAVQQLWQDLRGGNIAHAYLLAGRAPKTKEDVIPYFVQSLLCTDPDQGLPCRVCTSCRAWEHRAHPDYHFLKPDGGSLKTEQIRLWRPFFQYSPQLGRHHLFLLERPELLTPPAANSLLKVLEEPLEQTVFLLVTEDERGILPTILSRCRVVIFRPEAAARESGDNLDLEQAEEIARIIRAGKSSELLHKIRLLGNDRARARALLVYLLDEFEREYRQLRLHLQAEGSLGAKARGVADSLEMILAGLRLLDENVSVPLLLSLNLYKIQKKLQEESRNVV